MAGDRYVLHLESLPGQDPPDPIQRLRRLLKFAKRSTGFRCTLVGPDDEPIQDADETKGGRDDVLAG